MRKKSTSRRKAAAQYPKIATGFAELLSKQPVGNNEQDAQLIQELQQAVHLLLAEVKNMDEFLALLRKKQYGRSSEQTPQEEQTAMFNEAEAAYQEKTDEPVRKGRRGWDV